MLKIRKFMGNSENAVRLQLIVALIASAVAPLAATPECHRPPADLGQTGRQQPPPAAGPWGTRNPSAKEEGNHGRSGGAAVTQPSLRKQGTCRALVGEPGHAYHPAVEAQMAGTRPAMTERERPWPANLICKFALS